MRNSFKHGFSLTRIYTIWNAIIQRCTNPNNKSYKNYGGRGITVCNEWLDFLNFKKDMELKYLMFKAINKNKQITIERIDNNKGYSKENCTFITKDKQSKNRRNVHSIVAFNLNTKEKIVGSTQTEVSIQTKVSIASINRYLHGMVKKSDSGWMFKYLN